MSDTPDSISAATQRRHLEVLRANAAAKAGSARAQIAALAEGDSERHELMKRAEEYESMERNYAAQIGAIDRGEPVAFGLSDRALVKREIQLLDQPVSPTSKRLSSESLGEIGAGVALREDPKLSARYREYYSVIGFERSTSQGFDQIWRNQRGDHLVVEAKGGESQLAEGQMGLDWVVSRARTLAASRYPRDQAAGQALLDAMADPDLKVEGVTVAQRSPHDRPQILPSSPDGAKVVDYKQCLARRADRKEIVRAAASSRSIKTPRKGAS